mmetsp:Transcript_8222/g.15923  ORF Transcript_8222/g.15923 Transcript_8222/m.15923 type:complete len:99 (+) Transcript_8222:105-401(+)
MITNADRKNAESLVAWFEHMFQIDQMRATLPREFPWPEETVATTTTSASSSYPSSPMQVTRIKAKPSEAKLRLLEAYFMEGTSDLPCFELQNMEVVRR